MSGHGYAHGQPPGYYSSQSPYPTAYNANPPPGGAYPYGGAVAQSFEHNRNVIPGLNLGLFNGATEHHQSWAPLPVPHETSGQAGLPHGAEEVWRGPGEMSGQERAPESMDEGELSEGELEDIYEPQYTEDSGAVVDNGVNLEAPSLAPTVDNTNALTQLPAESAQQPSTYDRAGSYSPYLSPHEIDQAEITGSEVEVTDKSRSTADQNHTDTSLEASVETVAQARKRAQDAILRLWPLDVRYQDYINEGIDGALIQELFRELGLREDAMESRNHPTKSIPTDNTRNGPSEDTAPAPVEPIAIEQESAAEPKRPAKNPAEERKDRIARLLAAKGSKQAAAPAEPAAQSTATSVSTPSGASSKHQSEKSKLLHQKMEALKRAREAQAQKVDSDTVSPKADSGDAAAESDQAMVEEPSAQAAPQPQADDSELQRQTRSDHQHKRPAPLDSRDPSEGPSKRPFGHTRQSQPFLIDVSDDEDDEAMDLDSPELRPTSVQRPSSPFKITPYRDLHTAPNPQLTRQVSSPIATPPISNGGGKGNLESMNKEIELMKRKIAEAEARKKVKPSTPGSPAVDQVVSSRAESVSSNIASQVNNLSPRPQLEDQREASRSANPQGARQRNASRSRSRAASDRLPVVEAHRKEQLLKLQALQSQVRKIEKEIEESLREEEILRNEADDQASSDEHAEADKEHEAQLPGESTQSPYQGQVAIDDENRDKSLTPKGSVDGAEAGVVVNEPAVDASESDMVESSEEAQTSQVIPLDAAEHNDSQPAEPDVQSQPEPQSAADEPSGSSEEESREEEGEASDDYEPAEAEPSEPAMSSDPTPDPASAPEETLAEGSDDEAHIVSTTTPITQPISIGKQESKPASPREANSSPPRPDAPSAPSSSFIPYESPLKYFRAYRFHPSFHDSVPGGLRSLTYSNKIDVKTEFCPDQLAGSDCPRGDQCDYQHFETMQAPDDQILLQLGAYGNYEGEQKQEYINGLRTLLTDFRNRKVKDFTTISQGILNYRAQFRKDPSKVLPLGDVTL